jgi:predicted Zn-dependent peptidase
MELYGLAFDHYRKYPEKIGEITREEVNRMAEKYLNLEAYVLATPRPPLDRKE